MASPAARGADVAPPGATVSSEPADVRMRHVCDAVATLERALGPAGGAYRTEVAKWLERAKAAGGTLAKFPSSLRKAGERLPAAPPSLRAARDTFVRSVEAARRRYPDPAPAPRRAQRSQTLSSEVRAAFSPRTSLRRAPRGEPVSHSAPCAALLALV